MRYLQQAAFDGNLPRLLELLNSDGNVDERDADTQKTALEFAIDNDQTAAVKLLLDRGADPNLPGVGNNTPLHLAVDSSVEAANHRLDTSGVESAGPLDVIALLLSAGADPYRKNDYGESAFDWAQKRGHVEAESLFRNRYGARAHLE